MSASKRKNKRELEECLKKTEWYIDRLASYLSSSFRIPVDDLKQEGFLGMARARELYNPEIASFMTYSQHWIKTYMFSMAYKNSYIIHIPEEFHFIYSKYKKKYLEMHTIPHKDRVPLIAKELGLTEARLRHVVSIVSAMKKECTLEVIEYCHHGGMDDPYDTIDDSSGELLAVLKNSVTPEEYFVINHMLGLECPSPKTLIWVGGILGVTKERIRQIKNEGLRKFKIAIKELYGDEYGTQGQLLNKET